MSCYTCNHLLCDVTGVPCIDPKRCSMEAGGSYQSFADGTWSKYRNRVFFQLRWDCKDGAEWKNVKQKLIAIYKPKQ